MAHGFEKLRTAWNSAQEISLYDTWKMELDTGSLAIWYMEKWKSTQEASLYDTWKMKFDTESLAIWYMENGTGTRHRELISTHCSRTGAHIMEHCTNYSLHAACNEVRTAWETRHLKPLTTQNKKQGTHYTARIWKGLLALALHLRSCCSPDLLCSATTPKTTGDLHSPDPQTHHLLAERNQVISQWKVQHFALVSY